jgi:hypothetical protein
MRQSTERKSHATIYVSSYYYICVLKQIDMRPHSTLCGPHTTIYVHGQKATAVMHYMTFGSHRPGAGLRPTGLTSIFCLPENNLKVKLAVK